MSPKPVHRLAAPAYPTRREFLAGSAALLLAAGCGNTKSPRPIVAPVFEHGEGQGATGCIVTAPPVFLSEEEAMQVIKDEVAKAGIHLGARLRLNNVKVERISAASRSDRWLGEPKERLIHGVSLDAVDRKRRVAVEFVSRNDNEHFDEPSDEEYRDPGKPVTHFWSSVKDYDTKELAQQIATAIQKQGKDDLRVGVFYDPLGFDVSDERDQKQSEETAKLKSKALLRQQAQDFVAWLKEQ